MSEQDEPPAAGVAPRPETRWVPTYPRIRRIDAIWCRIECLAAALMFLAMGLMVFASVVPEIFGRRKEWTDLLLLFGLVLLGIYTRTLREGERRPSLPVGVAIAAVITAVAGGAVWLYVRELPGGFIWAQKLAMVLMIWVAMIGASIATYDRSHLSLELGEKLWPARLLRFIKGAAHAVTAVFSIVAFVVAARLVVVQHDEGAPISAAVEWLPTWVAFLVMPYAFGAMTIRFLAQAVTEATETAEPPQERLPS
jgi:TRAP-type C4-dicarboxylate transport system permease small subunit